MSHAIASLEDYLGIVLFSRGRYGARLTPVGDRVLAHARVIVEHTQDILQAAAIAKGLVEKGQVRWELLEHQGGVAMLAEALQPPAVYALLETLTDQVNVNLT